MPTWLDLIDDPSVVVPPELYIALQALELLTTAMASASGIGFTYDEFFSLTTTTVDEALKQIADYLGTTDFNRRQVSDFTLAALVDATDYFHFLMTRDRVLGLIIIKAITTPPVATDLDVTVLKNGLLVESLSIVVGSAGAVYKDLSHVAVVIGDLITIRVVTASGTVGLACTLEV